MEERKKKALIPIEEIRVEADNKLQEAEIVLNRANEKEKHNDELASVFEKRFDELTEAELAVKDMRHGLTRREVGIKQQEKHTAKYAEGVSKAAQLFLERSHAKEEELEKLANTLQAERFASDVRKIAQDDRDRELDAREANLKSRYEALAQAEEYIKKQKTK